MKYSMLLFIIMTAAMPLSGQNGPEIEARILRGIELTVSCRFDSAERVYSGIVTEYPDSPAGYFFKAVNLQYKCLDCESDLWEEDFYGLINHALELGQKHMEAGDDGLWAEFYVGSTYGYEGLYQGQTGALLQGFMNGKKGKKFLEDVIRQDSTFYDAYLGTGNYLYWASKYLHVFFWVPDRREEGIAQVKLAVEKGKYGRWIGLNSLGYIYYDSGQFEKAATCFKTGLSHFPGSRFYLWGLADSYFRMNAYQSALDNYKKILASLGSMAVDNGYNEVVCRFKMLKCLMGLEAWEDALGLSETILNTHVEPAVAKRVKKRLQETVSMRQECLEKLGRIKRIQE